MTSQRVAPKSIPIFKGRRILLGVTGSIAAYKSAELASELTQLGAQVDVILTEAALKFVSALTFQSLTGRRAYRDADLWGEEGHVLHVGLAKAADLYVVAPATANTLAKLVHGEADSLLTLSALAAECPTLIAPAMDAGMYEHPAVRANVATLQERGVEVVGPGEGRMASGLVGLGRMSEPQEILGQIRRALGREGPLKGRVVVVSAGGTQEPLDPVRIVTNRSSGKQGFALAQAALDRGARVTLVTAPVQLPTPVGARRVEAPTAAEMEAVILREVENADALLMAAAVADFRPLDPAGEKIKKDVGPPELKMEATEDILMRVAERRKKTGRPRIVVGFAAESRDLVENAQAKLRAKGLSLIVANDITASDAGFDVDTNRAILIDADSSAQELPLMTKLEVAEIVLEKVERMLN